MTTAELMRLHADANLEYLRAAPLRREYLLGRLHGFEEVILSAPDLNPTHLAALDVRRRNRQAALRGGDLAAALQRATGRTFKETA
ncbi:MAG: hypothetical protein SFU83_23610 [Meiothermus sp.]|nr:hypothetical protein [Meiothermus sp.]